MELMATMDFYPDISHEIALRSATRLPRPLQMVHGIIGYAMSVLDINLPYAAKDGRGS